MGTEQLNDFEQSGADSSTGSGNPRGVNQGAGFHAALLCERVTRSVAGEAVLLSRFVFPAHLTEFVVELPKADQSIAPSGLRLVD